MSEQNTIPLPVVEGVRFALLPNSVAYAIGDDGSVWGRRERGGVGMGRWRIGNKWRRLKQLRNTHGRMVAYVLGQQRTVQRLVLLAFVGPCPEGMQCCHDDGNKTNNRVGNLRWDTPKANAADRDKHGTVLRGSRHRNAKLTETAVREIRRLHKDGMNQTELGKKFGVTQTTIWSVIVGRNWGHVTQEGK